MIFYRKQRWKGIYKVKGRLSRDIRWIVGPSIGFVRLIPFPKRTLCAADSDLEQKKGTQPTGRGFHEFSGFLRFER